VSRVGRFVNTLDQWRQSSRIVIKRRRSTCAIGSPVLSLQRTCLNETFQSASGSVPIGRSCGSTATVTVVVIVVVVVVVVVIAMDVIGDIALKAVVAVVSF